MADQPPLLEMLGIDKRFGDVAANRQVDLTLRRGEVLGLLGENGAGKTTLMNILYGLYQADAGTIRVEGRTANIESPFDAIAAGIGMVHQHAEVVLRHTVIENLMTGKPAWRLMLDRRGVGKRLGEIGELYGLALDPNRLVADLSVGERQRLEIIHALLSDARILVLDEPTAVLTPQQAEGLFKAIRALTASGVGVIFISHKLNEIRAITSRVVVMRHGRVVAELANDGNLSNASLAQLMCGHELTPLPKAERKPGAALLRARDIVLRGVSSHAAAAPIDLSLHAGEIVGLAGVSGNGQAQLAETLAGVLQPAQGQITVLDQIIRHPTPRKLQDLGLAYLPEDRQGAGLIMSLSLVDSMILPRIHQSPFSRAGWIDRRKARDWVRSQIKRYDIRPDNPDMRTSLFSGGNQQKAIVARALFFAPRILIIAYPTRGLDVSATEFVYRELLNLRERGCAILVVSDDLEEIFTLSDRIAVMYESKIVLDVETSEATVAKVGLAMAGDYRSNDQPRNIKAPRDLGSARPAS